MRKIYGIILLLLIISAYPMVVAVTPSSIKGNLCYSPKSHDFGYLCPGEKATTQFEVWACCGCQGGLSFNIVENCSWIEVSPTSGYSTGERHTITVTIDTTGLQDGAYAYPIKISSNDGVGFFEVKVNVSKDAVPPSVWIVKPEKGALYINDEKKLGLNFTTVAIGRLTIEINASGGKSDIRKVDIYINGKKVTTCESAPCAWEWNRPGFMRYKLVAVAENEFGRTDSDEIIVWKFF